MHLDDPEEGSGWGTCVYLWRIHGDICQNQHNIVKLKRKEKEKKNQSKKNKKKSQNIFNIFNDLLFAILQQ